MSILKYSEKHSITKASIYFGVSRSFVYKLKSRFDGSIDSIKPHSHPNKSSQDEYTMITNYFKRNPNVGLIILWAKLRMNGYSRSITTLYRSLLRLGLKTNPDDTKKYYQYTAIDEYSRYRYLEVFDEISSYNSSLFIKQEYLLRRGIM